MVALKTAKLLANRGHNVILFAAVGPIAEDLKNVNNLKVCCLEQYDILNDPNRIRACIQGIWNFKAAKVMKCILDNTLWGEIVVHIHTLQKAISTSIIPVIKRKKCKIIYHAHDYGIACPNLGFYNYKTRKICRKIPLSIWCVFSNCDSRCFFHKIWRVIRQVVQQYIGGLPKSVDKVIFVTTFSKNILKKYICDGYVINNPLEISHRRCVDVGKNEYVIYIGRLSPEKNPVMLAKAARDLKVPIIFIGDGECRQEIRSVNYDAVITGWLDKDEMMKYIFKARYLVFPSLWYETQGLVVSEVAAYGIPSIVSNACAAKEFIVNGKNGLYFESGNLKSLEDSMRQLKNNKLVDELGRCAYESYDNSQVDYIKKLECLYVKEKL